MADVSAIRARYLAALEQGMSIAEATRHANGINVPHREPSTIPPPSKPPAKPIDPLDHDGDGKKGGSEKPPADPDLAILRAEYQAKFGKKPFAGWKADQLREKLAA